jgi:hypothetical protein
MTKTNHAVRAQLILTTAQGYSTISGFQIYVPKPTTVCRFTNGFVLQRIVPVRHDFTTHATSCVAHTGPHIIVIIIIYLQGLSLSVRSVLKTWSICDDYEQFFLLLQQVTSLLTRPCVGGPGIIFRVSFHYAGCLPWLASPVYPPRNHQRSP